jgi:hypothetical protein|tara:strand:- start:864 stop:1004 length:141 start_codon:yes stop_codon:yes gene_type:complete
MSKIETTHLIDIFEEKTKKDLIDLLSKDIKPEKYLDELIKKSKSKK